MCFLFFYYFPHLEFHRTDEFNTHGRDVIKPGHGGKKKERVTPAPDVAHTYTHVHTHLRGRPMGCRVYRPESPRKIVAAVGFPRDSNLLSTKVRAKCIIHTGENGQDETLTALSFSRPSDPGMIGLHASLPAAILVRPDRPCGDGVSRNVLLSPLPRQHIVVLAYYHCRCYCQCYVNSSAGNRSPLGLPL